VPSLFEGFGLPVLDGMTHGAAVVCSDIPALREVGGNAAVYTEPTAPGLARALHAVITDPTALAAAQKASLVRARQFSWDRAASQTADSLRRALG
jgi:glycosyltransferase involved in cell wall biosynthesis